MTFTALDISANSLVGCINDRDWSGIIARGQYKLKLEDRATGQVTDNIQQVADYFRSWVSAFPDLLLCIRYSVKGPDAEVAEVTFIGHQSGELQVEDGIIPPTSKSISFETCIVLGVRVINYAVCVCIIISLIFWTR